MKKSKKLQQLVDNFKSAKSQLYKEYWWECIQYAKKLKKPIYIDIGKIDWFEVKDISRFDDAINISFKLIEPVYMRSFDDFELVIEYNNDRYICLRLKQ